MLARQFFSILLLLTISINSCAKQDDRKEQHPVTKRGNPVLDRNFPDPTVIAYKGTYYAYATNGNNCNIQLASSVDLINWKIEPDALPQKPGWASSDFWAPHVLYDSALHKFIMFYSGESNDSISGKCLGVAFSDKPTGPFTDMGDPLICGSGFINIDPMAMIDPVSGKRLLYWGSGFAPLMVQEMTDDWRHFLPGTTAKPLLFPGKETIYTNLLEGSWVDYHQGKYYLYYSGDNCCGNKANYAVMVARADHADGPFTRLAEATNTNSSVVLKKNATWLAPGHNSIIRDSSGQAYMAYHAIEILNNTWKYAHETRAFCISPLNYKEGWPVIDVK
ncbi:MAG: glycoside hydrolase family 43 protein [Bacteroidota bacterium]